MNEPAEKQQGRLCCTLGLSAERSDCRSIIRKQFLTSPGYDDLNNLDVLVAVGLMTRGKAPTFCSEDEVVYRATGEGKQVALDELPPLLRRPGEPSLTPTSMSSSATTPSLTY